MLKHGVLEDKKVFFEKLGISQGSILSPFLFNVYMHEFDIFIENLIRSNRLLVGNNSKSDAAKEHTKIFEEFHPSKAHIALKHYGSFRAVKEAMILKKKMHYKKYHIASGTNIETRNIVYVRYANDFLIGVVGPKKFAIETRNKINGFIKSNLHLQIKKDTIINRNNKSVPFLGFLIKLPTVRKKTRIIQSKREATLRYKRRVIAKMSSVDVRVGKSLRFSLVKALSEAAASKIKPGETIKASNINIIAQRVLSDFDFDKLSTGARSLLLNIKHLKRELNKINEIKLEQIREVIEALRLPESKTQESLISVEMIKLKNNFLQGISKLQNKLDTTVYTKKRKLLLAKRENALQNKKIGFETVQKKSWDNINVEDTIQLADALTDAKSRSDTPRLISVYAPIHEIVDKLRVKGFFHPIKNRYCSNKFIAFLENHEIVRCYSQIIESLLNYYAPSDNFSRIRAMASQLKLGCVYTIARKHNKGKHWVYLEFGKDCTILNEGKMIAELPSDLFISSKSTKYPESPTK